MNEKIIKFSSFSCWLRAEHERRKCFVIWVQFNKFPGDEDDKKNFFLWFLLNCWAELNLLKFVKDWNWWELWRARKVLKAFFNRKFCTMHNFVNFSFSFFYIFSFRFLDVFQQTNMNTCPVIVEHEREIFVCLKLWTVHVYFSCSNNYVWFDPEQRELFDIWHPHHSSDARWGLTSTVTCVDFCGRIIERSNTKWNLIFYRRLRRTSLITDWGCRIWHVLYKIFPKSTHLRN